MAKRIDRTRQFKVVTTPNDWFAGRYWESKPMSKEEADQVVKALQHLQDDHKVEIREVS